MRSALALAFLATIACTPALAWNGAGHRLAASIAWDCLDSGERQMAADLLRAHPDREHWLVKSRYYRDDSPDYVLFVEASTWADDIRHDPRFEGNNDIPALAGFPDMAQHRDWHYDNLVLSGKPRHPEDGQLTERIRILSTQLGDKRRSPEQQAYALVWLLHLVADIHQPLHVVSRYNQEGKGDEGGNSLAVYDPSNPRHPYINLHAYWDDLPGPPWLRGKHLRQTVEEIRSDCPAADRNDLAPEAWRDESFRLARDHLYPANQESTPTLDGEYRDKAHSIANRRVAQAGTRLANLLHFMLKR